MSIVSGEKINKWVRSELIELLRKRDGPNCAYCNKELVYEEITIDHYYPKSSFDDIIEAWHIDNLRIACFSCNNKKANNVPLPDGTIIFRQSRRKGPKDPKPEVCQLCMSGRLLSAGEICTVCGSGPQPRTHPKYRQRSKDNCDHAKYHCWACVTGVVKRKSKLDV